MAVAASERIREGSDSVTNATIIQVISQHSGEEKIIEQQQIEKFFLHGQERV